MEDWLIKIIEENAHHIAIMNDELGQIVIRLTILEQKTNLILGIVTFVAVSIGGLFIGYCWKKLFKNSNSE